MGRDAGTRECLRKIAFALHYRDSRSQHADPESDVLWRRETDGPWAFATEEMIGAERAARLERRCRYDVIPVIRI